MICWQQFKKRLPEFSPAYLAGHSLGECCALYAANALSAEDTISLVSNRGAFMEREGTANPGGMRAVLGLNIEQVEDILRDFNGPGRVVVANHNTAEQIVISGDMDGLDVVGALCKQKGGKVIPLKVSVANHSPLVAGAIGDYQSFLEKLTFAPPEIPVIFNLNADVENDPAKIPALISQQIGSRVRWYESIVKMVDNGVELFVELGPKPVLTGLVKKITGAHGSVICMQADTPEGLEKVVSVVRQ
jgi:[acyl-carrier-protein] S-malonyltransferase